MLYDFIEYEQRLTQMQVRSWLARRGDQIVCREGELWLTEPGGQDVILQAGERYQVQQAGQLVIEATAAAQLQLQPASRHGDQPSGFWAWLRRLTFRQQQASLEAEACCRCS